MKMNVKLSLLVKSHLKPCINPHIFFCFFAHSLVCAPCGSWLMQLIALWLILMSMSTDLSLHYNSITAPFTSLCSFSSGPRGGEGSWCKCMHYLYLLKGPVQQKKFSCTVEILWKIRFQLYWFRNVDLHDKRLVVSDLVYVPVACRWFSCAVASLRERRGVGETRSLVPLLAMFLMCSLSHCFFPLDPLHAYLGLCGLSLIGEPGLRKVHPALNITQRAFQHLQQLQQTWRDSASTCSRQHWQQHGP